MSGDRKPRQHKTPRQRAEEALGVATRNAERATGKAEKLKAEYALAEAERIAAVARRDFLAGSPDLADTPLPVPEQDPPTTEEK